MKNKFPSANNSNVLETLHDFISKTGLDDVKTSINTKTGTASITGTKDGFQYTTTVKRKEKGVIQTQTSFDTNLGKEALVLQVKELLNDGYRQQEVADMLGISQSLVSKYSRL